MKELKIILLSTISVFAPLYPILLIAFVLVTSDLILGLLASRKNKISVRYSSALRRSLTKIAVYEVAICLSFLASQMIGPLMPVTHMITSYVGLTELISCLENLNIIAGGSLLDVILAKLGAVQRREESTDKQGE